MLYLFMAKSTLKATDDQLIAAYQELSSVWKVADRFEMSGQTVHERLTKIGAINPMRVFSEEEKEILRQEYQKAADAGRLSDLAATMERTKPFIARQARALGLTNRNRTRSYMAGKDGKASKAFKAWLAINEHPRGMLGKKHSTAVKKIIAASNKKRWEQLTEEQRDAHILKQIKNRFAKYGTLATNTRENASWKAGWRNIGGVDKYYRSRWEANYARYLELLKNEGKIASWEHEPKTFWFEEIMRGSRSYLPDFRVTDCEGNVTYHEVKGWMDARSKTKLARMAKYYPEISVVVIDKDQYNVMNKFYRYIIDGWE